MAFANCCLDIKLNPLGDKTRLKKTFSHWTNMICIRLNVNTTKLYICRRQHKPDH